MTYKNDKNVTRAMKLRRELASYIVKIRWMFSLNTYGMNNRLTTTVPPSDECDDE